MNNFNRGSEWRRWDLHIHTPGTLKNDNFTGETLDKKFSKISVVLNNDGTLNLCLPVKYGVISV